jgi:hypothetical protein
VAALAIALLARFDRAAAPGKEYQHMPLLDEIVEAATDDKVPIGTLLRKCLVLEHQLKNEKFRVWLDNELDGYDRNQVEDLPSYRTFPCVNKGVFVGAGRQLNDQPIPLHVMEQKDRKLVQTAYLNQPAASYDVRPDRSRVATLPWPPELTTRYQTKFFEHLVLNRAWQEIPDSVLVALTEQVRTRVLRFALELRDALPATSSDPKQVSSEVVERSVINNIYGGNVRIAAHAENISQMANTEIAAGDLSALKEAMERLGVSKDGIKQLERDIEADKKDGKPAIGDSIKAWVADIGKYLGTEGAKAGVDVIKKLATKWILQHSGLDIG